jgi:hypothetical protein
VSINTRIGVYTNNFHKCWCFYLLLQDTSKYTWNDIVEKQVNQWHRYDIIINNLKFQIGLHHCDGIVEMIETDISLHTTEPG